MNGAVARTTRRQLRRSFGLDAVATVKHLDTSLESLAQSLELQRQAIVALVEIRNRSLWGRLTWLVTGR